MSAACQVRFDEQGRVADHVQRLMTRFTQ